MTAVLRPSDLINLAVARTIAAADERSPMLDALSLCESPTLTGIGPDDIDQLTIHAALLGQAQAYLDIMVTLAESLATELDETRRELAELHTLADDAIAAAFNVGLASCGHAADADGECGCSWWPERAPANTRPLLDLAILASAGDPAALAEWQAREQIPYESCIYWWHDGDNVIRRCELAPNHEGMHQSGQAFCASTYPADSEPK